MQIERPSTSAYLVNNQQVSSNLSDKEKRAVENEVNNVNKSLVVGGRQNKQAMDKNDFLTLLITQLKNQDPSAPMEDKQFIAQMAQFSTLEQMNNMTAEFQKLTGLMSSSQALGILGKSVDITMGDQIVSGQVNEVTSGQFPQVLVNGVYYDYKDISRVRKD